MMFEVVVPFYLLVTSDFFFLENLLLILLVSLSLKNWIKVKEI
jgi:hypothetical protein